MYSASKGVVNSPVDGHTKKNTDLQFISNISFFCCSHSVLSTRTTYGNSFILVFLESHSGWPNDPCRFLKKNQNAPRPFEHPPIGGMSFLFCFHLFTVFLDVLL